MKWEIEGRDGEPEATRNRQCGDTGRGAREAREATEARAREAREAERQQNPAHTLGPWTPPAGAVFRVVCLMVLSAGAGARGRCVCRCVYAGRAGSEGVGANACRSEAWEIRRQVRTIDWLGVLAGALFPQERTGGPTRACGVNTREGAKVWGAQSGGGSGGSGVDRCFVEIRRGGVSSATRSCGKRGYGKRKREREQEQEQARATAERDDTAEEPQNSRSSRSRRSLLLDGLA